MLILFAALVVTSFAEASVKTCRSVHPHIPKIQLHFEGEFELLARVSIQETVVFEAHPDANDIGLYFDVKSQLLDFEIVKELERYAVGENPYSTVTATLITSAKSDNPWLRLNNTFATQMETISHDASGVAYFEFFAADNTLVGSSVFVGMGGFFKDCR